jgi:hypothetical protein
MLMPESAGYKGSMVVNGLPHDQPDEQDKNDNGHRCPEPSPAARIGCTATQPGRLDADEWHICCLAGQFSVADAVRIIAFKKTSEPGILEDFSDDGSSGCRITDLGRQPRDRSSWQNSFNGRVGTQITVPIRTLPEALDVETLPSRIA